MDPFPAWRDMDTQTRAFVLFAPALSLVLATCAALFA
jgi:hypothetical protein